MPPDPARPYRIPFRERWLLIWAAYAERAGRPDKAWRRLTKLEAIRPLALHELAFKALLLLRTGAPERFADPGVRQAALAVAETLGVRSLALELPSWCTLAGSVRDERLPRRDDQMLRECE